MQRESVPGSNAPQEHTAIEAAAYLGVSQRTVRRAIARGDVPARKVDGVYRIAWNDLQHYAHSRSTAHAKSTSAAVDWQPVSNGDLDFPRTALIGRDRELAELHAILSESRPALITLTGPGGVGKTRLALEAATQTEEAYPGGLHLIGLAPVRDSDLVPAAIARSFGLEGGLASDAIDRIARIVRDQRVLLVLDNLEQVIAAGPSISRLFHRCQRLSILCTSRAPLRISDEQDYAVPPLALADPLGTTSFDDQISAGAIQLFVARAQTARRDFAITPENASAVAAICHRLDGLPLAIELAATRIRVLPPDALLARLDPRLPMLTGGPRDRPSHQQTVRDTIAWSYDLLSLSDRTLFQQLSVFVGGFTLDAAEAVTRSPAALDGIANLIDQSLIQQSTDMLGATRYAMLETVREYGLELLASTPEMEESSRSRHAAWMLDYARKSEAAWSRFDYAIWTARMEVERGNLRAALSWSFATGRTELTMSLAIASNRFWRSRGPISEGVDWLERALALAGDTPPELRVRALELSADLATVAGDLDLAARRATEGEALAREIGDPGCLDLVLSVRARILFLLGEPAAAIPILEEALSLGPIHGWKANTASDLCNLGVATRLTGDPVQAVPLLEAGRALANEIGLTYVASTVIMCLADALRELRKTARAQSLYRDGLRLAIEQGERRNQAIAISGLAALAANGGDSKTAARLCGSADTLLDKVGAAMTPGGQECYGIASRLARAALGDAGFEREWSAGRELPAHAVLGNDAVERPDHRYELTRREKEVLRLLAEGYSNRDIADMLFISSRTVVNHVANILAKLQMPSRTAAVGYALRNDLL